MTEVETTGAGAPESGVLSGLETSAVRAVEVCLVTRQHDAEVAAGAALALLKGTLKHGAFTGWVRDNLPISQATVDRYLKTYRRVLRDPLAEHRLSGRGRESYTVENPSEELRALLLALSVIARQGLPLVQLVEASERDSLREQARKAAALMERLASDLSGGKVQ